MLVKVITLKNNMQRSSFLVWWPLSHYQCTRSFLHLKQFPLTWWEATPLHWPLLQESAPQSKEVKVQWEEAWAASHTHHMLRHISWRDLIHEGFSLLITPTPQLNVPFLVNHSSHQLPLFWQDQRLGSPVPHPYRHVMWPRHLHSEVMWQCSEVMWLALTTVSPSLLTAKHHTSPWWPWRQENGTRWVLSVNQNAKYSHLYPAFTTNCNYAHECSH